MIKNILVPQDGSAHSRAALEYALWLSSRFEACLTGLYVVDVVSLEGPFIHDVSASMGFEPFLNFSARMREVLEGKGREILSSFDESCRASGVKCSGSRVSFGIVTNEICETAKLSDLVVMGRHGVNEEFEHGLLGAVTEGVIRKSPKPVLITPREFKEPRNPLLAYDGSANAAKALHSAAEWSVALKLPLTVICVKKEGAEGRVAKGGKEGAQGGAKMEDAKNYLKPYGIAASFVELAGDPGGAIVEYSREHSHDLVFMGVTRHSRIVEMVLGSTTERLIRSLPVPFLLER